MFRRGKLNFLSTKDDRIKIISERINITEKHLIEMCCCFATCTAKLAKYRDSYDELAKSFKNYADDEEVNETLSEGLKSFTNATTILGDYMDIQVHRMEVKLVNELSAFENLCKTTRENLRTAVIARDREVLKQRQMLELKSKFAANNSAADSELLKAKLEVNRTNKEIDKIINNFEQRKLSDVKTILTDFVLISMKFHTKALEALSASYYDVSNIDERCDLMEFQKLMKTKEHAKGSKLSLKKTDIARSQSMESLDRDQLLSPVKRLNRKSRSTKNLTARSEDELDGEDGEEDDEEDDDVDDDEEEADSEENSVAEEDDSGSASDDDDDDDEDARAQNDASAMKSSNNDLKKIKSKFQAKPTAKPTTLTTVYRTKLSHNQTRPPFAAKGAGLGIPTTQTKRNSMQFEEDSMELKSDSQTETGGGDGRLVTVVESKKVKKRSVDYGVSEVIDCTRANARNFK